MKRGWPRDEMRDLDLHPDHLAAADAEAAPGMLQRAKRHASSSLESLSSSLEEPSSKLRRLRSTAEARYESAPSARELRAATREAVRDHVSLAAGATASEARETFFPVHSHNLLVHDSSYYLLTYLPVRVLRQARLFVRAANEEFDLMADEVAEVARKADRAARKAARRTAQAASAVQAQAASAMQGIQARTPRTPYQLALGYTRTCRASLTCTFGEPLLDRLTRTLTPTPTLTRRGRSRR